MHDAVPSHLLLIDLQQGFDAPTWGRRNNSELEATVEQLLAAWRAFGLPVVHVRHASKEPSSPLREGDPGHAFKPEAAPLAHEPVVEKRVNSCFIGTSLESRLREARCRGVVLAGLTTQHCVSTSARMASNLGFPTWVLSDATATFDRRSTGGALHPAELVHEMALADLHEEFATVLTTVELLRQLEGRPIP